MEICLDEIAEISNQNKAFEKDYTFLKTISNGAFGVVKSAIEKTTGNEVAVKIIEKKNASVSEMSKTKQEVSILKQLSHPNVVSYINSIETTSKMYIIIELMYDGTLKNFIDSSSTIEEEKSVEIIFYLLQAVNYIHSKNICHHDIKPENIMFKNKNDPSSLKLIDFGLSAHCEDKPTFCGTLLYMAPEMFDKHISNDGKPVDMWSIGIITAMLLNKGRHPFFEKGESKRKYIQKLKNGYIKNDNLSEMSNNFIGKLLEPNPRRRYSANVALKHPWITRKLLDSIPLTMYESINKTLLINKMKNALVAMVMLNRLRSHKEKKFKIDKEYIEQLRIEEEERKERFKEMRKRFFMKRKSYRGGDNNNNRNANMLSDCGDKQGAQNKRSSVDVTNNICGGNNIINTTSSGVTLLHNKKQSKPQFINNNNSNNNNNNYNSRNVNANNNNNNYNGTTLVDKKKHKIYLLKPITQQPQQQPILVRQKSQNATIINNQNSKNVKHPSPSPSSPTNPLQIDISHRHNSLKPRKSQNSISTRQASSPRLSEHTHMTYLQSNTNIQNITQTEPKRTNNATTPTVSITPTTTNILIAHSKYLGSLPPIISEVSSSSSQRNSDTSGKMNIKSRLSIQSVVLPRITANARYKVIKQKVY
jgi:calcium/calmodulin-dependent protein kinase I